MAEEILPDPLLAGRPEVREIKRLLQINPMTLENYHAVGEKMMALSNRADIVGLKGWRKQVAALVGKSKESLDKCCQFFEKYKKDQLLELEEMGVGWAMLTAALAVSNITKRHRLLRIAKEKGWSSNELQREIQAKRGSRRGGGRPRKGSQSHGLVVDLCQLTRLTDHWLEFQSVWSAHEGEYAAELAHVSRDDQEMLSRALKEAEMKIETQLQQCMDVTGVLRDFQEKLRAT